MKKHRECGSAVVDYIVPTAVVGLVVGLGLFAIYDSGALLKFFAASAGIEVNDGAATIGQMQDSGGLVGNETPTPSSPSSGEPAGDATISCMGGNCSIDLGDYPIDGIPEDLADYIEATSSSGGTVKLAELLNQIAEKSDLPESEKNLIKSLANLGHDLASNESEIESIAFDHTGGMAVPSNTQDYINELDSEIPTSIRSQFKTMLASVLSTLDGSSSTEAPLIKDFINILGSEIDYMARDMLDDTHNLVLGETLGESHSQASAEYLLNPDTSNRTDIDSALICATGNGQDQGYTCN